ncbi:MAG: 4-alpha-glucanotransferase [Clostridia bacterium]|nr:4-alpha-glucanotransferase [Clostridia bacterium]
MLKANEPKYKRLSGILLSLSSLPSDYGIGSFGREAFSFVDFLKKCRQSYWQLLPLCPVGKGNSPYCSQSTFAGEILLIDIDGLADLGLLDKDDIPQAEFPKNADYSAVRKFKLPLLKKAADNFNVKDSDFIKFKSENKPWLEDYALFMAIKDSICGLPFYRWPEPLKYRIPDALKSFRDEHSEEILFYEITQYIFHRQFSELKSYARQNGVKLIGDIPFYVSLDSADVWSNPNCFRLGRDMTPVLVAGVPPDVFSSDGQLWGNPIYDWDFHKKSGFLWWKNRLQHNAKLYDVIRIDHFRAFADYYTIPYGSPDAKGGKWEKGPGIYFWNTVKPAIANTEIIAEDLGGETREVRELIEQTGFPNMKVLQFAFDSDLKDPFLPKNFQRNCVCYTGTHDNDTTLGWYKTSTTQERLLFSKLVAVDKSSSPALSLIAFGMKSKARTVIIPLQDYMCLPSKDRMNTPGTGEGNWEWRFERGALTEELCNTVLRLSKGRN